MDANCLYCCMVKAERSAKERSNMLCGRLSLFLVTANSFSLVWKKCIRDCVGFIDLGISHMFYVVSPGSVLQVC